MLPTLPRDDPISATPALVFDIFNNKDSPASPSIPDGVYTFIALNINEPRKLLLLLPGFQKHSSFQEIDDVAYAKEYKIYENMSFMDRWSRSVGRGQVSLAGHVSFKKGQMFKWDVMSGHYVPTESDGINFGMPKKKYIESIEESAPTRKKMRVSSLHRLRKIPFRI